MIRATRLTSPAQSPPACRSSASPGALPIPGLVSGGVRNGNGAFAFPGVSFPSLSFDPSAGWLHTYGRGGVLPRRSL